MTLEAKQLQFGTDQLVDHLSFVLVNFKNVLKDMVGLVSDGLERYTIFLNSNVLYLRSTVHFSFLVKVSRVVKYFFGQKHENLLF